MTRKPVDEHPPFKRRVRPGDKWYVGKSPRGFWYAGPRALGVYADRHMHRRWIFFPSWDTAFAFAYFRAGGDS